ncbi:MULTISPECIES: hydantoinase/oxoprolinase family protein [unclassified Pantoea]|uniref:hydantoinase/oxoprolinase family protein n=1 Tax=unclassified Pantoea TaxID=2630326 RepID=UPI0023DCC3F1|nr:MULTISPECIES: hydantoinase/oxoprolinase family protein [unclassified Pantoea]MDF2040551.1 hydantoinase/oxoprolinase family protein [Pantoea sp. Cr_R14]MDF2070667.1 hydantoinase/oxoprolinase family protein [Pantoea sp. Cr_R13]MDF2078227.1 hydantoinase/oxoprolinase family protein [Pantoea sp. Cr_R21]
MRYRVGVDIGGSFTDFAVLDQQTNQIHTLKVLSRPDKPGSEIETGLTQFQQHQGIDPAEIGYFTHGTTVGINAVIQRRGVRLALFATEGFCDVLELARLKIPHIHDLFSRRAAPLITRDRVFAIRERIDAHGNVLHAPDRQSVLDAIEQARAAGCQGIVVSLLHSYRNRHNEAAVKAVIEEVAPELLTSCSADIWPIIREYERTITATINAYVQPMVIHYLESFEQALKRLGVKPPPRITKSNGGVMGVGQAKRECVQMVLSGTASGVIGASYLASACGFDKILSLDIGGTSADVAVIIDGKVAQGNGEIIGDFPIFIPSVAVTSVGQGGGSLAWIDGQGVLQMGPDSAGSLPGPVCFQRGGTQPTATDAFAACGMMGHGALGYNAVTVDVAAARAAWQPLADALTISIEETAETAIQLAISSMYSDTSGLLSRFGLDPREFWFLAFGGAGPMMGCFLARELNMKGVIVPPTPGVLSALGGLVADIRNDFIRTLYGDLTPALADTLASEAEALQQRACGWLTQEHGSDMPYSLQFSADMRYHGQSFEIDVPLEANWLMQADFTALHDAFDRQHQQLFGHSDPQAPVQLINLRLVIASPTPKPVINRLATATEPVPVLKQTDAWIDGAWHQVDVVLRTVLLAGHQLRGPVIIAQNDCTTCVPPGMNVTVDSFGNLLITANEA